MIMVTDAWLAQMEESTDYVETVIITLSDNTQITLGRDDLRFGDNISSGSESNSVPLGEAICKTCTIHIDNSDGTYDNTNFLGATIVIKASMYLTEMEWTEEIVLGTFYVSEPQETGTVIEITGVDAMHKADKPFAVPQALPMTAANVFANACQQSGLQYASLTFYNYDFQISTIPTGLTCRQVIGYIALIACGNAVIDANNCVDILTYYFQPVEDYPDDWVYPVFKNWVSPPNLYANDITITGVKTVVTSATGEETTYIQGTDDYAVSFTNPLITGHEQEVVEDIWSTIAGIPFFPFSGSHTGYPMVEFMDSCIVIDIKGGIHYSFVTQFEFTFLGTTQISNTLPPPLTKQSVIPTEAAKVEQRTHEAIKSETTRIDTAIANINQRISGMSGLYITEVEQQGGGVVIYQHDKPTLAESQKIWMETAETRAVSLDGGQTWTAGITADGNAIVRILTAVGISASWIDTGTLQVSNNNGDILFLASVDTGTVNIAGWVVSPYSFKATNNGLTTGLQIPSHGVYAIAVGSPNETSWGNAPFRVTHTGAMYAANAEINGSIRTVADGRYTEIKGGYFRCGKIDTNGDIQTGSIRPIAWGDDYANLEGVLVGATENAKYLVLGYSSGSSWIGSIIINNGLNPHGYTQRVIIDTTSAFRRGATFYELATFKGVLNLSSGDNIKAQLKNVDVSDGTTTSQCQGMIINNYGLVLGRYSNHDGGTQVVNYVLNNGCNRNGHTERHHILGTVYFDSAITFNNVTITQPTAGGVEAIKADCRLLLGDVAVIAGYKMRVAAVGTTAGSIYCEGSISCTSLSQRSDEKLKDITEYDERYTDVLDDLVPINYTWKDLKGNKEHVGLGARHTKAVIDDAGLTNSGLVCVEPDTDEYSINYSELTVMLLAKVQQQQKTIDALESRIKRLETLVEGLL